MARLYRDEDDKRTAKAARGMDDQEELRRTPVQNIVYFTTMVLILIFAAWGKPAEPVGFWNAVYAAKWYLAGALLLFLGYQIICWFDRKERAAWVGSTWSFSNQILPLLFAGVLVAGLLMGRPGTDLGLIPSRYVSMLVGGNTLTANLMASVVGAFMYFATLTEVPILQGLIGSGMGQGPALALLLAGPALSLPNMLVIRSVLGTRKTVSFVVLVVTMSTLTGMLFGAFMA